MNNLDALLILNAVPGLGPARIERLVEHFGQAGQVLAASRSELIFSGILPAAVVEELRGFPQDEFLREESALLQKYGAHVVIKTDEAYPDNLREVAGAPVVLYIKGRLLKEQAAALALVGSRQASVYGMMMAEKFAVALGELGITVVSGLARGIDAYAHRGALRSRGQTIAVLGNGLQHIYPPENKDLFKQISSQGAIVSEFPMATPPTPKHFPRRNRILSGLSLGVVVVEASEKSGALITADFALEQGREVFAVPGKIDSPNSRGVHNLIKQGAKLVASLEDILEELRPKLQSYVNLNGSEPAFDQPLPHGEGLARGSSEKFLNGFSIQEKIIYNLLNQNARPIDQIVEASGLRPAEVAAVLLNLELRKVVKQLPGKIFVKG